MANLMSLVADKYDYIIHKFQNQITSLCLPFDYDIFMDTVIKCDQLLRDKDILSMDIEKYLWVSFKNNTINHKQRNKVDIGIPEEYDIEVSEYDERIDKIEKMIVDKFGEKLYDLFIQHINGLNYDKMPIEIQNIKYQFRKIREFIRQKLN